MIREMIKAVPGAVWLKRRLFGPAGVSYQVPLTRAGDRGRHPQRRELPPPPDFPSEPSFVLYRIIGNDLVPRHRKGQARENLPFILEQEPELATCEKRFVVNRIVDPAEEAVIIEILERAGVGYLHIPFELDDYAAQPWDIAGVPPEYAPGSARYLKLRPEQQARIIARLNRHKNNYVVHNNGARNAALAEGRTLADWVLPWDGNCFLTESAWADIRSSLTERPQIPAWLVPMARMTDNTRLTRGDFRPNAREEPQVILRADCPLEFNPEFFYGRRPKIELFWRLGVPGKWDEWGIEPWDLPCPAFDELAGAWEQTGWVARLSSGRAVLEQGECRDSTDRARARARAEATLGLFDQLDERLLAPRLGQRGPLLSDDERETDDHELATLASLIESAGRAAALGGSAWLDALPQQCTRAYLMALAGNFQDLARMPDPTQAHKFKRSACELILELTQTQWDDVVATPSRAWRWFGPRRGPLPCPDLFDLVEAVEYLSADGQLREQDLSTITAWLENRYELLEPVATWALADASDARHVGAYYLEASSLARFLRKPLWLRDNIRDAQLRFRALFLDNGGADGATLAARYPAVALHWLQLIELAERLIERSRLTDLEMPALADSLTRAMDAADAESGSSVPLDAAGRYARGKHIPQAAIGGLSPGEQISLDRRLRFRARQAAAEKGSDHQAQ